mgnify:CR=1 FL=1
MTSAKSAYPDRNEFGINKEPINPTPIKLNKCIELNTQIS